MTFVSTAVSRWIQLISRFSLWVVLACGLLVAVFFHLTTTRLGINTSTADMIAEHLPWRQHFIAYREAFPAYQNNLVVVIDGATSELSLQSVRALADELQATELFVDIYAPTANEFFEQHGLLFLDTETLETLSDRLVQYQPVLARLTRDQSVAGFFQLLNEAISRDQHQQIVPVTQSLVEVVDAANQNQFGVLSWADMLADEDKGNAQSNRQFLILKPKLDFSKLQPARAAIEAVRNSAAGQSPGATIRITGPVALEFEELQSVTKGVKLAGLMALALVTLFLYLALRSWYLIFASLITLISGLLGTAAFAAVVFGSLNLISVAFAVLYVGLGIDFAIHFCLRFRELRAEGFSATQGLVTTGGDVGASLAFCAVTTAAGFFSFFPTEFSGVSELGVISGAGMFIGLSATLTLLPALLALFPSATENFRQLPGAPWSDVVVSGKGRLIQGVTLSLTLLAVIAVPFIEFDSDPLNLRDPNAESVATFTELMQSSDTSPLTLVALLPEDQVFEAKQNLKDLSTVSRVISLADFVPTDQEETLLLIEDLAFALGPEPSSNTSVGDDYEAAMEAMDEFLRQDVVGLEPLQDGLSIWRNGLGRDDAEALSDLRRRLFATLPTNIDRIWRGLEARPVTIDTLPDEMQSRWLAEDGRHRVEIFSNLNLLDAKNSESFVAEVKRVLPEATGVVVVNQEAGKVIAGSFRLAFVYAFVVVFLLLFIWLRSLVEALIVLLPIVLAGLVTLASMVLFGLELNYANIIALPLLLGIGVDNGIHIMHRHLGSAGELMKTSTARAVFFSTLTTIASFGNLAFSPHLGTASMGMLLTLGMLFILYMTLIFMPTLLPRRHT
ncbi:MAG: efflux RND transporter permease subunit [Pseudomonadota bacterium]